MTRAVRPNERGSVGFRALGPLEVVGEQDVLTLTAPKQRAIVTALLVQANRVVPFDRLAEAIWGD